MENLVKSSNAASGRVGLKLGALFVLVFGGLVIGFLAWDILSMMSAKSDQVVRPEEVTVIDPKIEADLKKVLEFQGLPPVPDVKDPFRDRADLSGAMAKAGGAAGGSPTAGGPSTGGRTDGSGGGSATGAQKEPDPVAETLARFQQREERIQRGLNAGPEAEVFAVDDLIPVGTVSGGSGRQEVLVYSRAIKRTFSFPLGTKIFDGWIAEVRAEGVAFIVDGKTRVSRVKLWANSAKDLSSVRLRQGEALVTGYGTLLI